MGPIYSKMLGGAPYGIKTYREEKTHNHLSNFNLGLNMIHYFSEPYILIPAGVIVGIGEACYWPCAMIFIMHYAAVYAKYAMKSSAACITQFLGFFYTCLSLASVRYYSITLVITPWRCIRYNAMVVLSG